MRHDDKATAIFKDFFESGKGATDTGIIGYVAVLIEGHIEVNTHNGFLACEIVVVDCHDIFFTYK